VGARFFLDLLRPVIRNTMKDESGADIPKTITTFRSIINSVKRSVLNESESYKSGVDIQDASNLNGYITRIRQFGAIILMILDGSNDPSTTKIREHFKKNNLDLSNLSDEDKDICRHYVYMDITTYTLDTNPDHIISVVKLGDA
jgi:hypothetical protein